MTDTAKNITPTLGRRSSVELGLVLTLLIGAIGATSAYLDVRQRLESIEQHTVNTWTATHQHLWIQMAGERIDFDKPLPTVHEVRAVYHDLQDNPR
ncbi:MAG: hypothetical protein ACOCYE_02045 [Pseudomonadota bacterium]